MSTLPGRPGCSAEEKVAAGCAAPLALVRTAAASAPASQGAAWRKGRSAASRGGVLAESCRQTGRGLAAQALVMCLDLVRKGASLGLLAHIHSSHWGRRAGGGREAW